MFAFLPLLLMAADTPPADEAALPAYPAEEVLSAFATACSGAEDTAVNIASAEAAGWERLPADADTPVSALVRAGMAKMAELAAADGSDAPEVIPGAEFRRTVAGRELFLSVSGTRDGVIAVRGCRLYDYAAPRALALEEMELWAVRQPNDMQQLPDGTTKATFNPGLKPGHMELEIFYIPPGAQPVMGITMTGISLVATAVDL